jgi:hypothetical protein
MQLRLQCDVCGDEYEAKRRDQRQCGKPECKAAMQRGYALRWYHKQADKEEPYSVKVDSSAARTSVSKTEDLGSSPSLPATVSEVGAVIHDVDLGAINRERLAKLNASKYGKGKR